MTIKEALAELLTTNLEQLNKVNHNPKLRGWVVGQVMKKTGGKANPKEVNDAVNEFIDSFISLTETTWVDGISKLSDYGLKSGNDNRDHGINGVARQKDVQKLQREVDELKEALSSAQQCLRETMTMYERTVETLIGAKSTPSGSGG